MEFKVGAHVRIAPDYPGDKTLQSATGNIVALPNDAHREEYLIRLDGGVPKRVYLEGRENWFSADWLESVGEMSPDL
jgi:hypothetical protein